jgi:hypothetical protein
VQSVTAQLIIFIGGFNRRKPPIENIALPLREQFQAYAKRL